ncbi:hypothetical protein BCR24_13870 [Enterococcus ureilyticus]|uniref:OmpR/PhoB-type domain-containing protein n=1 Tax=Enterococcus ureilyticus TaxID=1131292 RepID=A0A1E5HDP8_9ENTE|nr:winged helix-turn-helix domain-containing protein [Enterococcus ureilyticus]MBM7689981.1 two-component system response regulator VicR [Enterococcus ureilyticus]MBO0447051.1 winged helix-turn-helix transcriptional regulator [Enterococcus ureilyticus]OEG23077.1 hypothetical protein BCR24_13870 [Enterococcus ureilyticus]
MYHIGLIALEEQEGQLNQWRNKLPGDWIIRFIEPDKELNLEHIDLLLYIEETSSQIGEICEKLVSLKDKSDFLSWVWIQENNRMNRLVYLNLGADFVAYSDMNQAEWLLIMTNAIKRNQKKMSYQNFDLKKESQKLELIERNNSVLLGGEKEVLLTRIEFRVLNTLYDHPKVTVSYEELYASVWKDNRVEDKSYRLSNIIFHLRKKMGVVPNTPEFIKTVRSKGYMLDI